MPAILKALQRRLIEGEFLRRQKPQGVQGFEGALRFGVEGAQRFDFVIKEVDAKGVSAPHGKDVDERTSDGILPMLKHRIHSPIARGVEALQVLVSIELIALTQG